MKVENSRVVYTAVFGDYDNVSPVDINWECDFVCFTDNPSLVAPGWDLAVVPLNGESPSARNRWYKFMPHEFLQDYQHSLYIDGNISVLKDPSKLFDKYLTDYLIAIPKHEDRNCAYFESEVCIKLGKVDKEVTRSQMKFGMTENGIIFRSHNSELIKVLMINWWSEYCSGGKRDQFSLPYLIWKHNVAVCNVEEGPRICEDFFTINLHAIDEKKTYLQRLARRANGRKHLGIHYYIISKLVYMLVTVRDTLIKNNKRKGRQ